MSCVQVFGEQADPNINLYKSSVRKRSMETSPAKEKFIRCICQGEVHLGAVSQVPILDSVLN